MYLFIFVQIKSSSRVHKFSSLSTFMSTAFWVKIYNYIINVSAPYLDYDYKTQILKNYVSVCRHIIA